LYQLQFSQYAAVGISLPNSTNFPVYARALNTVTGDFAQNPNSETVASALSTISSLVSQQLGANSVETVK
jgi:hypothetical protein